jgi:hypothetical protein
MSKIKESLLSHISSVDRFVNFGSITGESLTEWFMPFINSLSDEGAIPYLLESSQRYRASPLASAISWLNDAELLPVDVISSMQNELIFLRDNNYHNDADARNISKFKGDENGWSLAEGVSVWSTSLSIIALNDIQGAGLEKAHLWKDSVIWLLQQQDTGTRGWAYQAHRNCDVNIVMTSLATRALALAFINKSRFKFSDEEERQIRLALNNGYSYIKDNVTRNKGRGIAFWSFKDQPSCAATTWALSALRELSKIIDSEEKTAKFFEEVKDECISFIITRMPTDRTKWPIEQIVCEAGAKYGKQKNYFSFSATLLMQLFSLGLSPYHPKVVQQIKWIINNRNLWKIEEYDQECACTFTYAMVLATFVKWVSCVGTSSAIQLLKDSRTVWEKATSFLFGFPVYHESPVQLAYKPRLLLVWGGSVALIILIQFSRYFFNFIRPVSLYILKFFQESSTEIIINVVAAAIYAALFTLCVLIIKTMRKALRRLRQ